MLFSKKDFEVHDWNDFLSFLLILPFLGLVGPFLAAVWTLGYIEKITGWLDT